MRAIFTASDFRAAVEADLFVLGAFFDLPEEEPVSTQWQGNTLILGVEEDTHLEARRESVEDYGRGLVPAIFIIAQKVYAEIFHLFVAANGETPDWQQFSVEAAVRLVIARGPVLYAPFKDAAELEDWWNGQYSYSILRRARNKIVHTEYQFKAGKLEVMENGATFLSWSDVDVLSFAVAILEKGKSALPP